ncbi:hypothetical protein [Microcystis phage Mae-JY09]
MNEGGTVSPITQWLTTGQVALALGVSPTRVVQLANYGRLECVRLGNGTRLFDPDVVRAEAARRER